MNKFSSVVNDGGLDPESHNVDITAKRPVGRSPAISQCGASGLIVALRGGVAWTLRKRRGLATQQAGYSHTLACSWYGDYSCGYHSPRAPQD
ncbi:MAG: hypothetical protein E3J66_05810 [Dehalococcoidia bacterium]|nr:MAG: hypothetical protein E3J66_05810 [Dehalococcoidia bacterium]